MAIDWLKLKQRIKRLQDDYVKTEEMIGTTILKDLTNQNFNYLMGGMNNSELEYTKFINTSWIIAVTKSDDQKVVDFIYHPLAGTTIKLESDIYYIGFINLLIKAIDCYQQKDSSIQFTEIRQVLSDALDAFPPDGNIDRIYIDAMVDKIKIFFILNPSLKNDKCFAELEKPLRWY